MSKTMAPFLQVLSSHSKTTDQVNIQDSISDVGTGFLLDTHAHTESNSSHFINLLTRQKVGHSAIETDLSSLDDLTYSVRSFNSSTDKINILELLMNNQSLLSDSLQHVNSPQAPLTSPELNSLNANSINFINGGSNMLFSTAHVDELAWLIPAVFVGIVTMIAIAIAFFYGIRALELKMMSCCVETFGCCCADSSLGTDEERVQLTSRKALSKTDGKAYQTYLSSASDPEDSFL